MRKVFVSFILFLFFSGLFGDDIKMMVKSCFDGNLEDCVLVGDAYLDGKGVEKDLNSSGKFFTKACKANSSVGCYRLGLMYLNGIGISKNRSKAEVLFSNSCKSGHVDACYNYGNILSSSILDPSKAEAPYKFACEGNHYGACFRLGLFYDYGFDDDERDSNRYKDYEKASAYYRRACDGGELKSCFYLARLFDRGLILGIDYSEVSGFYKKSCDAGLEEACDKFHEKEVFNKYRGARLLAPDKFFDEQNLKHSFSYISIKDKSFSSSGYWNDYYNSLLFPHYFKKVMKNDSLLILVDLRMIYFCDSEQEEDMGNRIFGMVDRGIDSCGHNPLKLITYANEMELDFETLKGADFYSKSVASITSFIIEIIGIEKAMVSIDKKVSDIEKLKSSRNKLSKDKLFELDRKLTDLETDREDKSYSMFLNKNAVGFLIKVNSIFNEVKLAAFLKSKGITYERIASESSKTHEEIDDYVKQILEKSGKLPDPIIHE